MKKIFYILFVLLAAYACKSENSGFPSPVSDKAFSFTPVAGGAVMRYKLPSDNSIVGIKVRYKDFKGDDILRSGSSLCDSLDIVGFNEAQHNVPAQVTLCKSNGEESEPVYVTFNTQDSGPVAFFNNVQVRSGWNGFSVLCDNPVNASGMAHVFYLGKNPQTQEPDTILIKSFNLKAGKDTLMFQLQQLKDENTVIIRTEDFRGYAVKEKAWEKIASYNTSKLDPSSFDFYCDKSINDDEDMIGSKYLFDGDKKGESFFLDRNDSHYRTFVAGPYATGLPMYIDLRKPRLVAQLRLYAQLPIQGRNFVSGNNGSIWGYLYYNKLPSSVTVYAAKDNSDNREWDKKDWVQISKFNQSADLDGSLRWCVKCASDYRHGNYYSSKEEINTADSIFMGLGVLLDGQGEGYRYLKIVVNDVFRLFDDDWDVTENYYKYVTFQELEVYGKKED